MCLAVGVIGEMISLQHKEEERVSVAERCEELGESGCVEEKRHELESDSDKDVQPTEEMEVEESPLPQRDGKRSKGKKTRKRRGRKH